jgi:hypothetical protein
MIDWVIENIKWLFSGSGPKILELLIGLGKRIYAFGETIYQKFGLRPLPTVLVVLGLFFIGLGIYLQFRSQPKTIEKSKLETTPQITHIDPYSIREKINLLPPYQQDEARKNYLGVWIEWKGRFSHMEKQEDGSIKVSFQAVQPKSIKGIVGSVWFDCTVRLSDYPQLKIMDKGTEVIVIGKIVGFDLVDTIVLDDVKLSII